MKSNENYIRLVIAGLLSWYFINYAEGPRTVLKWNILDSVDLIIHEAGHTLFSIFGEFINILGGSLFQILVPIIFVVYFFVWRKEYYSGSLLLFWVGQSILNVSVYIADSIKQELPLLGGDSSIHDWNYILNSLNLLKYTDIIATITYDIGFFAIITATLLSCYFSWFKQLYDK